MPVPVEDVKTVFGMRIEIEAADQHRDIWTTPAVGTRNCGTKWKTCWPLWQGRPASWAIGS